MKPLPGQMTFIFRDHDDAVPEGEIIMSFKCNTCNKERPKTVHPCPKCRCVEYRVEMKQKREKVLL